MYKEIDQGWKFEIAYQPHENKLYRRKTDILGDAVRRANAADQREQRSAKQTKGHLLCFSPGEYQAIVKANPDLESRDRAVKQEAWNRFVHSPLGKHYLRTRPPGEEKVFISK